MVTATTAPVLAAGIRRFTFHEGGRPALHDVELLVRPGTLTAVLGASGSGKTTLGRLLSGWLQPGSDGTLDGYLELAGTRLQFGMETGATGTPANPRINPAAWGRHVVFVPQDPAAVLSTIRATVAEELAFGLENAGMPRRKMVAAIKRTAAMLGLAGLLDQDPATLSGGQLRRLAIGCAVIMEPAVVVMDEPFASLDREGAVELAALVRDLVASGAAVVILSQAIEDVLAEAEEWVVLAEGTVAAAGTPPALGPDTGLVPQGIRRRGQDGAGPHPLPPATPPTGAAPALELRGVSFSYNGNARHGSRPRRSRSGSAEIGTLQRPVLQGVDLAVHPGEIVAVTGPNGAGKSTLLRHLNGLLQPTTGTVHVKGIDIAGRPVGETAGSVGLLFQHPRDQLFERTLLREVAFGLGGAGRHGKAGREEAEERAAAALAAVGLGDAAAGHPAELSASAQRLLALATVLARKPAVIALDEPTVALDGEGLAVLDAAVRTAAAGGTAVVLVTHDLDYARTAAHRILALDGGLLTGR